LPLFVVAKLSLAKMVREIIGSNFLDISFARSPERTSTSVLSLIHNRPTTKGNNQDEFAIVHASWEQFPGG
jgi:hypothetical protein